MKKRNNSDLSQQKVAYMEYSSFLYVLWLIISAADEETT